MNVAIVGYLSANLHYFIWWRKHPQWFDRLLFGADYPVPVTTAAWRPFLGQSAFNRLRQTANPFERMAVLLDELEIHPPSNGFERLLNRLGRHHRGYSPKKAGVVDKPDNSLMDVY